MSGFVKFIKTWKLPIAMAIGILMYFVISWISMSQEAEDALYSVCSHWFQPLLIFLMLFLSFLKVEPHDLRPHRWHGMLLLIQGGCMVICALLAVIPGISVNAKILLEGAMLCFICPTATASAVIVQKLDGSISGCVTYIILINLLISLIAPPLLAMVEPGIAVSHLSARLLPADLSNGMVGVVFMIMGKVFPLLLCPLLLALIVRHYAPGTTQKILVFKDLAFYLWLIALATALTVTVRTIVNSRISILMLLGLAAVSLLSCIIQFVLGRRIGSKWGEGLTDSLTAGQAFGQKNTVFVIWMGLMFLNPVTSVTGGFYCIWHNVINSIQLYRHDKRING